MEFKVTLVESAEGVAASCPTLRGCHSQGKTREEALANIRIAIREWLEAEQLEETGLTPEQFRNLPRDAPPEM